MARGDPERIAQSGGLAGIDPGSALNGTLRPYQQVGVRWLYLLAKLGLGACLADDMGLGKTIQILSLLLVLRNQNRDQRQPSLLVARPLQFSPIGRRNWSGLREFEIAHCSSLGTVLSRSHDARARASAGCGSGDHELWLVAAYSMDRGSLLAPVVIDEAQAIKNPNAKQTRIAKKLKAQAKFALTGTPVENRIGDLCPSSISSIQGCSDHRRSSQTS